MMMQDVGIDLTGLESFRPDDDLEAEDGIWVEFPGDREICVLRAGGSNHKFQRVFQQLTRPYARQLRQNRMDPKTSNEIMREAYIRAVIVGWRGWTTTDGDELPFTQENVRAVLAQVPTILETLIDVASDAANFSEEGLNGIKK